MTRHVGYLSLFAVLISASSSLAEPKPQLTFHLSGNQIPVYEFAEISNRIP